NRDSAKAVPFLLVGGLCFTAIGYLGLFFGRLIKAAVSRQREYLADAASIQFTRNPEGLAGALYKIHSSTEGSLLSRTLHAEDMSHMCFGETVRLRFNALYASHPPLVQRIRAIDPQFMTRARMIRNQQRIQEQRASTQTAAQPMPAAIAGLAAPAAASSQALAPPAPVRAPRPRTRATLQLEPFPVEAPIKVSELVGYPESKHFAYAEELLASWPRQLFDYAHTAQGAMSLTYALLIQKMPTKDQAPARQLTESKAATLDLDLQALQWGVENLSNLERSSTIPLLELCLGSLKTLDAPERGLFLDTLKELIAVDQRYSLFEFVVFSILRKQLAPRAE